MELFGHSHQGQQFLCPFLCLPAGYPGSQKRKFYIPAHIGIHDKIKMLKYHPYFQPFLSEGPAL